MAQWAAVPYRGAERAKERGYHLVNRMIGALRYANEELLHAHEAMARPVGTSRPGPRAAATGTSASAPAGGASVPPRRPASAAEGGKPAA